MPGAERTSRHVLGAHQQQQVARWMQAGASIFSRTSALKLDTPTALQRPCSHACTADKQNICNGCFLSKARGAGGVQWQACRGCLRCGLSSGGPAPAFLLIKTAQAGHLGLAGVSCSMKQPRRALVCNESPSHLRQALQVSIIGEGIEEEARPVLQVEGRRTNKPVRRAKHAGTGANQIIHGCN